MSSIALELDRTLQTLDPPASAALTTIVREAIQLVRADAGLKTPAIQPDMSIWTQRLADRSALLSTGRQGTPLQAVMDDIRG